MAKQKTAEQVHCLLHVRVSESVYARIERFRVKMARELPGSAPSVSDAVRVLLERSLEGAPHGRA